MAYKIMRLSDTLVVIVPNHWWDDPLSAKHLVEALARISLADRVVSVSTIGGWSKQYLVILAGK